MSYRSPPYYAETHIDCSVDIPGIVEDILKVSLRREFSALLILSRLFAKRADNLIEFKFWTKKNGGNTMKLTKLSGILFVTVLLIALFAVQAQAAESSITTDVLADILGGFNAMYETQMSDNTSIYVTGMYGSVLGLVDVFGVAGGVNYYLQGNVLDGMYAGGGLCFASANSTGEFSVDARFGYKSMMSESTIFDFSYGIFDGLNLSFGVKL